MEGIITALLTPLEKEGNVKKDGVKQILDFQYGHGINNFFLLGTFGEGVALSVEKRKRIAETFFEHAKKDMHFILHVGAQRTEEAVELAKHAKDLGAEAIAAVAPYFFRPDSKGLITHYQEIARAGGAPLFIYNNVGKQGYNISPDIFSELVKAIPEIGGIKDTSYDIPQLQEFVDRFGKEYQIIAGGDSIVYAAFCVGAEAHICGIANVYPEIPLKIWNLFSHKDFEQARKEQFYLNKLRGAFKKIKVDVSPYKSALKLKGVDCGTVAPPLRNLEPDEERELFNALKAFSI
jgi:dihydrodipicolinate synthase/N-acetylneuraminate lyase